MAKRVTSHDRDNQTGQVHLITETAKGNPNEHVTIKVGKIKSIAGTISELRGKKK